ncbi:ribonuclease HII [Candidatus Protofrankia californiensis]|uniref:ribonuclease HII n=1 Tax=Candidatus Protofrankia californiensis TaxID=1839754 RepID=UPI0010411BFC|nr:ribonuclease HII [Candidatus Protofrankia californiensis]
MPFAPTSPVIRRDCGLWGYERALWRRGLAPVAGVDEAGRGACAGPLVVAAVILPASRSRRLDDLTDSKRMSAQLRERVFDEILSVAQAWATVVIQPFEIDAWGVHVANIAGMRRAVARLTQRPGYVLTDGFAVPGLGAESTAVLKGDQVVACVAAASVVAKVTRDRIMKDLHRRHPEYDFAQHKGYVTAGHAAALAAYGPCEQHRMSYVNVAQAQRERLSRLEDAVTRTGLRSATESA